MSVSRKILVIAVVGALLLGLVGAIGAAVLGGEETPAKRPTSEQPATPREGPAVTELHEDAFAPQGEVGADH
ncbi:hypothetical protein [Nocardioides panzhihuensis]|uniref:DUF2613 family protein n=1 Tax=Nocardioides panzhihuensis TaxID=860243 RepID=A0A7Z0DSZ1_9ACTN|nr:hypothetical protein [Nocardioides panzhihuensis]NYI81083.1 hypothetical protein [Nocardioides panzhihuensis]